VATRQKDKIELDLLAVIKTARTSIRLRHSLAADAEINEKLPVIEAEFNKAIVTGKAFSLESFRL
jgi:hypothetical protein